MKYIVELNEDKDIFDLSEAIKTVGTVIVSEYDEYKKLYNNLLDVIEYIKDNKQIDSTIIIEMLKENLGFDYFERF